jgi:hypothetical protein
LFVQKGGNMAEDEPMVMLVRESFTLNHLQQELERSFTVSHLEQALGSNVQGQTQGQTPSNNNPQPQSQNQTQNQQGGSED